MDDEQTQKAVKGNEEKARSEIPALINPFKGGRLYRFVLDISLPTTEKFVLATVASYLNVDAEKPFSESSAWPSYDTIAKDTGFTKRTVMKAIDALETAGFVLKERRRFKEGGDRSNAYCVEPSLPSFFHYFEVHRMLKAARARDRPMYLAKLNAVSLEIWTLLQLDKLSLEDLAAFKPGLFEARVAAWVSAEKARGVDIPKPGSESASPPNENEMPGSESQVTDRANHDHPPCVPGSPPRGVNEIHKESEGDSLPEGISFTRGVNLDRQGGVAATPNELMKEPDKGLHQQPSGGGGPWGSATSNRFIQFSRDHFDAVFAREGRSRDESLGFDFHAANEAVAGVVTAVGFEKAAQFAAWLLRYKAYTRRMQIKPRELSSLLRRFLGGENRASNEAAETTADVSV